LLSGVVAVTERKNATKYKDYYGNEAEHKQDTLPYRADLAKVVRHLQSPPSALKESV
jgi:hypothetical protein